MSAEWAEQSPLPEQRASAGTTLGNLPGAHLAAQRKAMGWSVEQVADQLKLARRQVVALEAGDYAALPGAAVVRGFIRAYAKVVKLDAAPLVAMIPLDAPAPNDATSVRLDKPAAFSEVRFPTNGARQFPFAIVGGVVLLIVAIALAWQFGLIPTHLPLHADTPAASAAAEAAPEKPAPAPIETTLLKPDQELKQPPAAVPLISEPPPAVQAAPAQAAPVAAPAAAVAAAPAPAVASNNALVINAHQDSWVEVRRTNGSPVFRRLMRAGTSETVDITEPVQLTVGNAIAVEATLRGAALDLAPVKGGSTARLSIK